MAIHSFLKAERGDPDWLYSPEAYIGKEFKLIDASTIELAEGQSNLMVLRQNPTETELLAKHIRIGVQSEGKLDLIIVNEASSNLQQVFLYDIRVEAGGMINFGIFAKGGKFNKHIVQVYLEEGAEFTAYGLMSNTDGGDTEIITKIVHENLATVSNQLILGMAGKDSQTVFQATCAITEDADGTEANIDSGNLIIGQNGRCHSKPDIFADNSNVVTSYGSVTDHINADKIYYLQSKGLDVTKATQTILNSFQNQAIDLIPYEDIKNEVTDLFEI